MELSNTKVYRGGESVGRPRFHTDECSAEISLRDESLDFGFSMTSAGGGTTKVVLEVGKEDLKSILLRIAGAFPDLALLFSECLSTSIVLTRKTLDHERNSTNETRKRLESTVDQLNRIFHLVLQSDNASDNNEIISEFQNQIIWIRNLVSSMQSYDVLELEHNGQVSTIHRSL